jgi:hypothetical protein
MKKRMIGGLTALLIAGTIVATPAPAASPKDAKIFFRIDTKHDVFYGHVESNTKQCIADRKVKVLKKNHRRERVIARTHTGPEGGWRINRKRIRNGVYIAKVVRTHADSSGISCAADRSGNRKVS